MKAKQLFLALTLSIFMLSVSGCSTVSEEQPESMPEVTLEGTVWTLEAFIDGQTGSSLIGGSEITLKFEADHVRGSAGCNDYGGAYTLKRGALSIPQVDITGQLCLEPAGIMAQETRYLEILRGVTIFIWDADLLTLMTVEGVGLRFVATKTTAIISQAGPTDPLELENFLDAYFAEQMEINHIPDVVFTMVKDGEVFFSKGYGYADIETQTPLDPVETVLTTASLAKGFAANLAGYLTQEISNIPYEQSMTNNIFSALGMTDSSLDLHVHEKLRSRLATGYEYQNSQQDRVPLMFPRYAPSGGLHTTAADMNRFMLALLNGGEYQAGHILDQNTPRLMLTRQFTPQQNLSGIFYGFFEHLENGQQSFLRGGYGIGTHSRIVLFPEHDLGFFISYNSGDSNLRLDIINAFRDNFFPVDDSKNPTPIEGFRKRAAQFTGTYRIRHADTTTFGKSVFFFAQLIKIRASDEGHLIIEPTSGGDSFGGFEGASQWMEVKPLSFERVDGKGQIVFIQDESGQITDMVSGQGYQGTFFKLHWYETQIFHIILIGLAGLFLISMVVATFFVLPIGALIRKLRKRSHQNHKPWGATLARLRAAITSGMFALVTFWVIGVLYAINAVAGVLNFVRGISDDMVNALNSMCLPAILALALPVFNILAWVKGWWKISFRVYYILVTMAVYAGLWWAYYWNLLGCRY